MRTAFQWVAEKRPAEARTRSMQRPRSDQTWAFGMRLDERKAYGQTDPYLLPLKQHSGVVVGATEQGISQSLQRLARLAATHGWNVVYFDPQGSDQQALQFAASMWESGFLSTYHYHDPSERCRSYAQRIRHTHDEWCVRKTDCTVNYPDALHWFSEAQRDMQRISPWFTFPPGESLSEPQTRSASYIGINVWQHPEKAVPVALSLLTRVIEFVQTPRPGRPPLLLLIKHPHLLFLPDQLAPLFTLMEQSHDSVFLVTRTVADLGWDGAKILQNANTLILHRSQPTAELTSSVSMPWSRKEKFEARLRALPEKSCFIVHRGDATLVRLAPSGLASSRLLYNGFTPVQQQEHQELASLLVSAQTWRKLPVP